MFKVSVRRRFTSLHAKLQRLVTSNVLKLDGAQLEAVRELERVNSDLNSLNEPGWLTSIFPKTAVRGVYLYGTVGNTAPSSRA